MIGESSSRKAIVVASGDPHAGSSLVPMLVGGLVMIVLGMIAVVLFT